MTFPADHVRHGFELLRDHRLVRADLRNVTGGARVLDDGPSHRMVEGGDKINWAHWTANGTPAQTALGDPALHADSEPRRIGGWSMTWPAELHETGLLPKFSARQLDARFTPLPDLAADSADTTNRTTAAAAGGASADSGNGNGNSEAKSGFSVITGRRVPAGTAGIMVAATREQRQENLFVPAYEIVAQHAGAEAPRYSTPVYDLIAGTHRIDRDRSGGLHAHLRVAQLPEGSALNFSAEWVPAWNATRSVADATGFGAFLARGEGGGLFANVPQPHRGDPLNVDENAANQWVQVQAAEPTETPVGALAGWEAFGPLHPGHAGDKHRIGVAPETGMPWNSGHIWTNALFYRDWVKDGPLDFEDTPFVQGGDGPVPVAVHLSFDPGKPHEWLEGVRPGMWRWWTTDPIRRPFFPPLEPPPLEPPPFTPTKQPPTTPPTEHVPTRQPLRGPLEPRLGEPVDPGRTPYEIAFPSLYGSAIRRQNDGSAGMPYDGRFGGSPVDSGLSPADLSTGLFPHAPSIPISPETAAKASSGLALDRVTREWTMAPLTWHLQSFGRSDESGHWHENRLPGEFYLSATTDGGAWFTPPEILLDGPTLYPPSVSRTTFALYPGHQTNGLPAVALGWGVPNFEAGTIVGGPQLSATGNPGSHHLALTFTTADGAARLGNFALSAHLLPVDVGTQSPTLGSPTAPWAELHGISADFAGRVAARNLLLGTATDATDQGDIAAGLAGGNRFVYDQSAGTATFHGSSTVVLDAAAGRLSIAGNAVVESRRTGWSAPTGTATRTGFSTASVTLPELAEHVKALIDDLTAHGLIGP